MNVLVDMYICDPRSSNGWEGYTYRAWTSVVFLLYSGIAKPSRCVKNERTSRFFVCFLVLARTFTELLWQRA